MIHRIQIREFQNLGILKNIFNYFARCFFKCSIWYSWFNLKIYSNVKMIITCLKLIFIFFLTSCKCIVFFKGFSFQKYRNWDIIVKVFFWSSQITQVAGVLRIFRVDFDRLFWVRLGKLRVNNCPAEFSVVNRKADIKKQTKKTQLLGLSD